MNAERNFGMPRKTLPLIGALAAILFLSACGEQDASPEASESEPGSSTPTQQESDQVSQLNPCDLVTPEELKDATGQTFNQGEKQGPQCYFSTTDYASTASVSTGLKTVADHLKTQQIEIGNLPATQGESPEGDQCLVDVTLESNAPVHTLNTSISGADPAGNPCETARSIAEKAVSNMKG